MTDTLLCINLQVLLDDARDNTYCGSAFFINARYSEAHIVLLTGITAVTAGMCHRIDAIVQANEAYAFVNVDT